jgi:bifunctional N-acetylglucosamine-1-phosphate-uridyltransferase/glucosamine-1-phosphate-acetyltransferase GlmU-like protein
MIFVLSPEAESRVTPRLDPEASVVLQQEPTGMADAVALCEKTVKTPYTLVLWGDQITPRRRSLAGCMTLLESDPDIQAVIPTMIRKAPYIHFKRDPRERIIEVFQARESHLALEEGESDCGAFCFRTAALFRVLRQTRGNPAHQGARTGENNFLSLLPLFHDDKAVLAAVRLHDAEETLGINTPEDASRVEAILTKRGGIE